MKYVVLLGDGMAGRPLAELGGRTTLQAARTPNMDRLASISMAGRVRTVPEGFPPGSDVANLSIFGYDPRLYYSGRAPLEAASMGIELDQEDIAFRCNLVTLSGDLRAADTRMVDYSGGHITTEEARPLVDALAARLGTAEFRFHPGISYRHLLVWRGGLSGTRCTPPHDITGREAAEHLPMGEGAERLIELMAASQPVLAAHEMARARASEGKKVPTSIWLWGQGRRPFMPTFTEKYGKSGAIISAVDLTRGIGVMAGFEVIIVPGATGYIDTNYEGKAQASLDALRRHDFVYVHVEAPDEAGHNGNVKDKLKAIEDFDAKIVGPILKGLESFDDYRVLVLPDHPTPIEIRTHSADPVPFILHSKGDSLRKSRAFDERITEAPDLVFEEGHKLMDQFIGK